MGEIADPADTLRGVGDGKADGDNKADEEGEDLRAEDGAGNAFDGGIAAAELGAPPEDAGRDEWRGSGGSGAGGAKCGSDQGKLGAGAASGGVGA